MMALRKEDGLTLVEMLVAVAISSMVAAGLGTALHQFLTTSERTRVAQGALHDVQNTGHWLTIDGKKTTSTSLVDGDPATEVMTLAWTIDSIVHNITYYRDGSELKRDNDGAVITVARNVTDVSFSRSGQLITVNLESSPAGRWDYNKNATFNIWIRSVN
jgi:prepilin-type N-terminal cleavage/methylation domain-containing protein